MALVINEVTKRYHDFTAVDHLSFTIEKGENNYIAADVPIRLYDELITNKYKNL